MFQWSCNYYKQYDYRYETSDFKEGLIVLDDVNSAQVVEALNIGCKTLVTTLDQNVMNNLGDRYIPIKVNYYLR